AAGMIGTGRYAALVALGVVVRGETPHFDFVAGEASRSLAMLAATHALPVGFGLLTVDTLEQALARAGGAAGDKGFEAADAAIRTADALRRVRNG
ncbi:MAG TPA: 6,7-dimethyl-8-ribityllumazine synthase, partial [Gemmatimonadales bacterium]|nr:6,7-dimethyl-8-ribityllumazine synthase [Gemmatimonadales bacterium]